MNKLNLDFQPVNKVNDFKHDVSYAKPERAGDILFIKNTSGDITMYVRKAVNGNVSYVEFDYYPWPLDQFCVVPKDHKIFRP